MHWNTSSSILGRLKSFSSETAWTSLAEHFERPLTRYATRAGVPAESVQDVVQETLLAFAKAYQSGAYDRSKGRLSGWLFGIARIEVSNSRRRAARDRLTSLDSGQIQDPPTDDDELEEIWEEEWRRALLKRCIERVRKEVEPRTWECFALQTFERLSPEEVATRMSIPSTKVYNAKHRVSRRLRDLAREYEDA